MKHAILYLLSTFFLFTNVCAQQINQQELDYINYVTDPNDPKVQGSGEVVEEVRKIDQLFDEVVVGNGMQVYFTPDKEKDVKIVAQENALPLVSSNIIDNKLVFRLTASLETTKGIKLYMPSSGISRINVKEGSYLHLPANSGIDNLRLLIQSGAYADCDIATANFSCKVMGGSELNLNGTSEMSDIIVKGGSILRGKSFECSTCDITVLGSSECKLHASESLNARVENESTLIYFGNPEIGTKTTKLNGKIKRRMRF